MMFKEFISPAVGAAAFSAVAIPPEPASWEALAWSALSAVLATVLSWLTKRFQT